MFLKTSGHYPIPLVSRMVSDFTSIDREDRLQNRMVILVAWLLGGTKPVANSTHCLDPGSLLIQLGPEGLDMNVDRSFGRWCIRAPGCFQ